MSNQELTFLLNSNFLRQESQDASDSSSIFLKFTMGAVEGKYNDEKIFLGLVHTKSHHGSNSW